MYTEWLIQNFSNITPAIFDLLGCTSEYPDSQTFFPVPNNGRFLHLIPNHGRYLRLVPNIRRFLRLVPNYGRFLRLIPNHGRFLRPVPNKGRFLRLISIRGRLLRLVVSRERFQRLVPNHWRFTYVYWSEGSIFPFQMEQTVSIPLDAWLINNIDKQLVCLVLNTRAFCIWIISNYTRKMSVKKYITQW